MSAPNSANSVTFKDDVFKDLRKPNPADNTMNPSNTATIDEFDDESAIDDREHRQDWTRTTDPKDTWAERERRRSSVWTKLEPVSTISAKNRTSSAGSKESPKKERRGSILSMWTHGIDKSGKHVIHSGFEHDDEEWNK